MSLWNRVRFALDVFELLTERRSHNLGVLAHLLCQSFQTDAAF